MNAIYKSALSIVLLGLAAGCSGEPESTPPPAGGGAKANYPPPGTPGTPLKRPNPPASKPADTKKSNEPPAVEGPKAENSKPGTNDAKLTAEELAAIRELPPADQAAAIQQVVCPVSSHHLGSMDKPVKVTADGRTFYICCEGCEDKVKSDPKAVIAKLDKK